MMGGGGGHLSPGARQSWQGGQWLTVFLMDPAVQGLLPTS